MEDFELSMCISIAMSPLVGMDSVALSLFRLRARRLGLGEVVLF